MGANEPRQRAGVADQGGDPRNDRAETERRELDLGDARWHFDQRPKRRVGLHTGENFGAARAETIDDERRDITLRGRASAEPHEKSDREEERKIATEVHD
ncbi:MAG: hypothetical protein NVS3B20_02970 [Polyangiales bacterium]